MKKIRKNTLIKISLCVVLVMIICAFAAIPVFAEGDTGNVAQAIENTWTAAKGQVQTVVNNVVFPVLDMILAILFFVKVATTYLEYRKHGQFEFTAPAILFACLIIFRIQEAWSVRVHGTGNFVCVSDIFADSTALYLDDSLKKSRLKT